MTVCSFQRSHWTQASLEWRFLSLFASHGSRFADTVVCYSTRHTRHLKKIFTEMSFLLLCYLNFSSGLSGALYEHEGETICPKNLHKNFVLFVRSAKCSQSCNDKGSGYFQFPVKLFWAISIISTFLSYLMSFKTYFYINLVQVCSYSYGKSAGYFSILSQTFLNHESYIHFFYHISCLLKRTFILIWSKFVLIHIPVFISKERGGQFV